MAGPIIFGASDEQVALIKTKLASSSKLTDFERQVVGLRVGVKGDPIPYDFIAERYGRSRSAARHAFRNGMRKLGFPSPSVEAVEAALCDVEEIQAAEECRREQESGAGVIRCKRINRA